MGFKSFAVSIALAMALVGCAGQADAPGDDGATSQPPGTTSPADPSTGDGGTQPADGGEVTELGSITINGDVYAVNRLNRCESEFDDLDLQALAQGVKINLYARNLGIHDVSVDGSIVEEKYGHRSFGRDPVISESSLDSGRSTGRATISDSFGEGVTVDVEWDVQVPDEARDCSL